MATDKAISIPVPDDFDDAEGLQRIARLVIALLLSDVSVREILRRLAGWKPEL